MEHYEIEIRECIDRGGHTYRHPFVNDRALSRTIIYTLKQEFGVDPYAAEELPQSFLNKYILLPVDSSPGQYVTADAWYTIGECVSYLQENDFHIQFLRSPENGNYALFTLENDQLTSYRYKDFEFIIKPNWEYDKFRRFDGKFIFAKYINDIGKEEFDLLDSNCNTIISGFSKYEFSSNNSLLYLYFNGYESYLNDYCIIPGNTLEEIKAQKRIGLYSNRKSDKFYSICTINGDKNKGETISYLRKDLKFNKEDLFFYTIICWDTDPSIGHREDHIATPKELDPENVKYGGGWLALMPGFKYKLPSCVFEMEDELYQKQLELPAKNYITPIFNDTDLVCFYSNLPLTPVKSLDSFKKLLARA